MTLASAAFKTEFAVDMTCQSCVNAVQEQLRNVTGIERYDIDLANKRVTITGKIPPSQLLAALKATDRQVIVRGSSSANSTLPPSAAVSILESPIPLPTSIASTSNPILAGSSPSSSTSPSSFTTTTTTPPSGSLPGMNEEEYSQKVFGICRFVQIAPKTILMDLTVRLPPPSNIGLQLAKNNRAFDVYISSSGNMVDPPNTTGKPYLHLGKITPDKDGYGDMFKEVEGELWEWIGRGCIVEAPSISTSSTQKNGEENKGRIFAGVVARSAGAWGNDKTVCACRGRTMWEEGREMQTKSML